MPPKIPKPRPIRGNNPGLRGDSHGFKTGPKKPWTRAEEIGHRVLKHIESLNPFD